MNGFGFGGGGEGGFQFHLGVGAFPFGFFALFNNGRHGHGQMPNGKPLKILYYSWTKLFKVCNCAFFVYSIIMHPCYPEMHVLIDN